MRKSPKFSPEVIERAVRMVFDAKDQYPSQWAAIESIAAKIGCTAETLRKWVRQGERDSGVRPGPTTAEQQRIKDLEREVRAGTSVKVPWCITATAVRSTCLFAIASGCRRPASSPPLAARATATTLSLRTRATSWARWRG